MVEACGARSGEGGVVHRTRASGVALHWAEELIAQMRRVGEFPESGRMVPEVENPQIREIIYQDVRVIYRVDPAEIVVMTVWHTRRDVRKLLRRLEPFRAPRLMDASTAETMPSG